MYLKDGVINHGRDILRAFWWKKHRTLFRIIAVGAALIVGACLWSAATHYAVARMVDSPYF